MCSSEKGPEAAAKAAGDPWATPAGATEDSLIPGADEATACQRQNLTLGSGGSGCESTLWVFLVQTALLLRVSGFSSAKRLESLEFS